MKSSVRFQAAPIVFNQQESNHLDDSGSSCHSDNLDLLKALNLDEFSTAEVNEDKTIFEDSMYNRVNFVGRTPHSKVVEAKKERKALQELMKVPAFANNHYKSDFSVLEKNQSIIQSNMNGNKTDAQSRLLASTNSVKSSYSDTSYHFELVQQQPPIQDEEENYQPRVAVSFAKSASVVHFDEQNLAQNRLETPAASRKIPLRKTPAPQKLLSHEKSLTNSRITVEDLAPPNSVRPVPNQDSFEEVTKDSIILNNSMEISGISPANHQTNFASSINSASSGSPLASLISRPEVSKASPIVSPAPIVIKKEMSDAATSYSPPTVPKVTQTSEILINSKRDAATSYSYDVKTLQGSRSVTSESSLKPDLSSVSQESKSSLQSTSTVSSSADTIQMQLAQGKLYQPLTEGESAVNHTARSYAVPENNLRSASPWSLAKDGGVAFGRGPILSNIAHSVASIKQVVHHVASTVTEIPVLPKVNNHPNQVITTTQLVATTSITQDPETETIHSQTSSGSTDEACRMKPALDWFSPRHTRKPAPLHPSQFPFTPQTHHLQTNYLGDDVSRSSTGSSLSHSMQLQSIRVDKPLIMKSEQWKTAKICDVSVQVESEMLTSGITEVTKRKESLDEESSFDRSYTLEELMQSAATTNNSSTLQQFDDSRSTWQQRNLSKQSSKGLFDFTSCNIGGSPSTITNHFMDSRVNQSHNSSTPLQHTPSSAYSTSLSYTTIPSLHSDFQQEYIQRQSSTKAPSSLGKPGRVPLTVEKEEYIQAVWGNEEDEIIQNYQYCDQSHQDTIEEAVMFQPEGKYSSADVTILTDVAIANFTRDQQRSLEQYEDDYSIPTTSTSFLSNGLETTMTIDHSYMAKQESSPNNAEPFPRLAIRSLKRDAQNPFDIKEIGFETSPNELMTIMLTLKNDQKEGKTIKLTSKTIFLRVEPLYSQRSSNSDHNALEEFLTEEEKDQIFTVSPEVLEIPSKEEGMIFITFAPKKEGIYSGVLKITYRKKSFTLLLRGESSQQFSCQQLQSIANSQVVSTVQKQSKQSQVPSSVSFNSQNYQNSPETLQSVPPTTSKLNTSACFSSTIDSTNIRAISGIPTTPNDWTNEISPNTFQSKLRVLQKKIGEISNKITLKDTIHPRSSAFDKPIDMALTLPPSAQQKNNFFKQKKEELFLLQSNHSSAPPYSVNSKLSSSINYQADSEKSSLKRMVTKRITSSVTENSNLSISQGIAIPSPSVKSTTPSEWQQPMVVATVHSRNLVLEEQEMMIKKESVSQTNDRRSSEEVKATNNMELITTDNQEEYLLNATKRKGLFFRKEVERFGYTMIGSLVRTKIVLCNASHHEITVYFGDVEAPFYNHHSEVKMRPKSFVRVPIRFVPTQPGQYEQELIAQTADGKLHAVVRLVGTAASSTPYKS